MKANLRSGCPIAATLDLLGDRWTLVVLRDVLLAGRRRFSEFAVEEGIATNILTDRLERLECAGILAKHKDPVDRRRWVYLSTPKGIKLLPVLLELAIWGDEHTGGKDAREIVRRAKKDRAGVLATLEKRAKAMAKQVP